MHGDELIVTTTSPYEQAAFGSKTDWRVRAISATNLYLRVNHIYVNSEDIKVSNNFLCIISKHILEYYRFTNTDATNDDRKPGILTSCLKTS